MIVLVALGVATVLSLVEVARTEARSLLAWACAIGFGVLLLSRAGVL